MKLATLVFPVAILSSFVGIASNNTIVSLPSMAGFDCSFFSHAAPQNPSSAITLESVLKKMDAVAAGFHSAQAEFEWDNYQKVIDEIVDVETGTIYYRRVGKDTEMMADVKKTGTSAAQLRPEPKYVLFSEGKVKMYTPKTEQVMVYDLGKNRADLESYVVLGFGGSGQDLQKAFDVKFDGTESINGINAAKLELVPKSEKVRNNYNKMILWIDPDRGISVQQQFFTPQGDYRLCKYSGIKINEKIGDDVFKLKTTGKTQTISPTG
ncbi:MAG TPA: outer membrane lipoprotein carrier protein LolA [Candidatus Eisenbacteria bacterium]|nr:outer membrane lipoprotein carrier protein LolA [Candidatus Eisenbacteria bacterium]